LKEQTFIPFLGSSIEVVTWDSYGKEYRFRAIVKRVNTNGIITIGYSFNNLNNFQEIVKFVYGDSGRWERFWEKRERQKGILVGFTYLLRIGFISMGRNIRGVFKFLFANLKNFNFMECLWRRYNLKIFPKQN
jgi:cellulose synthase (UDP-forming)